MVWWYRDQNGFLPKSLKVPNAKLCEIFWLLGSQKVHFSATLGQCTPILLPTGTALQNFFLFRFTSQKWSLKLEKCLKSDWSLKMLIPVIGLYDNNNRIGNKLWGYLILSFSEPVNFDLWSKQLVLKMQNIHALQHIDVFYKLIR